MLDSTNRRWLFCVFFYSHCTGSFVPNTGSTKTEKGFQGKDGFQFFGDPAGHDGTMMAAIQRIKRFQYVDANQSFSETFFLFLQ